MSDVLTVYEGFKKAKSLMDNCVGITWDGCHKIYMAMNQGERLGMIELGYEVITAKPETMLETLKTWYKTAQKECGLEFIYALDTDSNGDTEFISVIPQI